RSQRRMNRRPKRNPTCSYNRFFSLPRGKGRLGSQTIRCCFLCVLVRGAHGTVLSEDEAAARGGDGAAEFFSGFDPFLNDDFHGGESFLVGLSVGGAAGKLGDFGDEGFVSLAPVDDDLVSSHRLLPPSDS